MGPKRYYDPEQRSHWPLVPPRARKEPILDDDTRTGNAAKDGFTALGPRRSIYGPDGIVDADEAAMYDRWAEDEFSLGPYPYY